MGDIKHVSYAPNSDGILANAIEYAQGHMGFPQIWFSFLIFFYFFIASGMINRKMDMIWPRSTGFDANSRV